MMDAKDIVKNVMETDNLPIAKPDDKISEILPIMVNRRLALIIVMENEQFLGIVTGGDLQRSIIGNEANFVYLRMEQIMNTDPITINENSSIADAEKLFKENNIIVLIVTDNNGKLVGVLRK